MQLLFWMNKTIRFLPSSFTKIPACRWVGSLVQTACSDAERFFEGLSFKACWSDSESLIWNYSPHSIFMLRLVLTACEICMWLNARCVKFISELDIGGSLKFTCRSHLVPTNLAFRAAIWFSSNHSRESPGIFEHNPQINMEMYLHIYLPFNCESAISELMNGPISIEVTLNSNLGI